MWNVQKRQIHRDSGRKGLESNLGRMIAKEYIFLGWRKSSGISGDEKNLVYERKSTMNIHWKDWCWSSKTLATWFKEPTHWKRPWSWERLRAGGEGGDRGWESWLATLTQWTWIWASFRRQWRTGKPGVLQSMGLQRDGHNLAAEQQQQCIINCCTVHLKKVNTVPPIFM